MLRRMRRSTASVDDSNKSEVETYRAILENVRADYPHLPAGALQQIALNQTKSQLANHPQIGKMSSRQSGKMQGILRIFQPSKRQAKNCRNEISYQDEMNIKPSHVGPSTRSIGMNNIACETSSSSLADHSLTDSLANIEERESELDVTIKALASAASTPGREERLTGGSWVRRRASKRISMMSNLSDVDEEKELPTQQPSAAEKEVTPVSQEYDEDALFTDSLPDEIKIVINSLPISRQPMPSSTKRQESERRGSGVIKLGSSKYQSENSSMSSIDTANFNGDFHCWKSVSSN